MEYIDLIRTRRSIRKYKPEKINEKIISLLCECLLRSPSSKGNNPWEFVIVDEREKLIKLSECKAHGSEFLKNAPYAIVVCANKTKSDVWIEDCSIAAFNAQLFLHSMGIGSCWVQVRKRKTKTNKLSDTFVRKIINAPKNFVILCIIAFGQPAETKKPINSEKLDYSKIHFNNF